jgi:hypothetical protein
VLNSVDPFLAGVAGACSELVALEEVALDLMSIRRVGSGIAVKG